jgi:hypothetical protein
MILTSTRRSAAIGRLHDVAAVREVEEAFA